LFNAMLSTIKQVPEGEFLLETESRISDPSMLPLRKAMTHASSEAIALMTQARVHDTSPQKQTEGKRSFWGHIPRET